MKFNVLTLFPDMFEALNMSILQRAQENNLIDLNVVNIRDFSKDKHNRVDDYPYGGGKGMVMTPQPIISAYNSLGADQHLIYMSPKGSVLTQEKCVELSKKSSITLLCGHYEGIDQRVIDSIVDEEISIGNYVLTGGELPAMVLIDSVSRLIPGVLSDESCFVDESIYSGLLEYPQYTRPFDYDNMNVPEILLSGHHENIKKYRHKESLVLTYLKRPDLLNKRGISRKEAKILESVLPDEKNNIMKLIIEEDK